MNTEMVHLSSREILLNIFKCVFIFYSIYYISCSICTGAFSIRPFNGKMPFDFVQWIDLTKCCASYPALQLANFISMEATYLVSTGAYILTLPTRLWDYAITITLFHILLSCLAMLSFPTNWSWWICLGSGLTFMAVVGETTLYGLKKLKQRREIMPIVEALEAGR